MSLIERVRGRAEEIRAKGPVAYLRELRGSSGSLSPQIPTLKEVREKGLIKVLEERFPRIGEMRARGVLARPIMRPPVPPELKPAVEEGVDLAKFVRPRPEMAVEV
jgi:hypothetical protein